MIPVLAPGVQVQCSLLDGLCNIFVCLIEVLLLIPSTLLLDYWSIGYISFPPLSPYSNILHSEGHQFVMGECLYLSRRMSPFCFDLKGPDIISFFHFRHMHIAASNCHSARAKLLPIAFNLVARKSDSTSSK